MLSFKLKPLRKQFQRAGKSARLRAQCVIGGMLRAGAQCIELRSKGRMSKNGECPALPVNPLPQPRAVKGRRRIELLMQPDQISAQRLCQGLEQFSAACPAQRCARRMSSLKNALSPYRPARLVLDARQKAQSIGGCAARACRAGRV